MVDKITTAGKEFCGREMMEGVRKESLELCVQFILSEGCGMLGHHHGLPMCLGLGRLTKQVREEMGQHQRQGTGPVHACKAGAVPGGGVCLAGVCARQGVVPRSCGRSHRSASFIRRRRPTTHLLPPSPPPPTHWALPPSAGLLHQTCWAPSTTSLCWAPYLTSSTKPTSLSLRWAPPPPNHQFRNKTRFCHHHHRPPSSPIPLFSSPDLRTTPTIAPPSLADKRRSRRQSPPLHHHPPPSPPPPDME
ncbi:hypothetical protein Droror1_Dr00016283 [Drosera rotundifolia]